MDKTKETFEEWYQELLRLHKISEMKYTFDRDVWKDYYNEGYSPIDALMEDLENE